MRQPQRPSEILVLPSGTEGNALRDIVAALDGVHVIVPAISQVPVILDYQARPLAAFENDPAAEWVRIRVSLRAPFREIPASFTHEVGHLMDALAAGFNGYGSEKGLEFERWRQIVSDTSPVRCLRNYQPDTSSLQIDPHTVQYLLRQHEIFARCYAQYVAMRSGNPALLQWLDIERESPLHRVCPTQWSDEEFAPVALEIDSIFRDLKWRI